MGRGRLVASYGAGRGRQTQTFVSAAPSPAAPSLFQLPGLAVPWARGRGCWSGWREPATQAGEGSADGWGPFSLSIPCLTLCASLQCGPGPRPDPRGRGPEPARPGPAAGEHPDQWLRYPVPGHHGGPCAQLPAGHWPHRGTPPFPRGTPWSLSGQGDPPVGLAGHEHPCRGWPGLAEAG